MTAMSLPALPPRPRDGHKGTFGHVLCLAGSRAYPGAAVLAARAALRTGAGLVSLGYPGSLQPVMAVQLLCEIGIPLPERDGVLGRDALEQALILAEERDAVALGPGITVATESSLFARGLAVRSERPLVLDADGLNAFVGHLDELRGAMGPRILTPHPGEAGRLLDRTTAEVSADRDGAAGELARRTGAVVVLKGAGTIVSDGEHRHLCGTGNPGMATGGTGDVLTGVIAALLARGLTPFDAAVLGAHLHGAAGDLAAADLGEDGLIASDILERLPLALKAHVRTGGQG
jgi:NAD(P)H-hydrate epimerase